MTGFARMGGTAVGYSWVWEVKSVNSKGLDLRFRLPQGFDQIEAEARKRVADKFVRGNLAVSLVLQRPEKPPFLKVNRDVLDKMTALATEFRGSLKAVNVEALMGLRGVIEVVEDDLEEEEAIIELEAAVGASFERLLDALAGARTAEGVRLAAVIEEHIGEIAKLTEDATELAKLQPERRKVKLVHQLDEMLNVDNPVPEDRIAQELALIISRGDVREELDRLSAHTSATRELLDQGGAIGRRLDFLCQEFNREANTLCSKSHDIELTRIGLDIKAAIERLREQIQNIE